MVARRLLLAWLACAVLAAQGLALLHRLAHLPTTQGRPAAVVPHEAGARWVAKLFAGHDDDAGCRLLDAVGQHVAPPAMPVLLPLLPPAFVLCHWQGEFVARWAALFDARGPPPFR